MLPQVLCLLSAETESGLVHFVTRQASGSLETSSEILVWLSDDILLLDLDIFEL